MLIVYFGRSSETVSVLENLTVVNDHHAKCHSKPFPICFHKLLSLIFVLSNSGIRASFVFKNVLLCKIVNQRMKKFFGFHTLFLESLDNEKDALTMIL